MATKTKKLKVNASPKSFTLQSDWRCNGEHYYDHGAVKSRLVFAVGPTIALKDVSFKYSLPSGAKIKKAQIWAKFNSPSTGCSIRTVNGNKFSLTSGSMNGANINLTKKSGTLKATFKFKANGNKIDEENHVSRLQVQDVYLLIEYTPSTSKTDSNNKSTSGAKFVVPPQSVAIYNQSSGKIYMFDGVLKIQHNFSVKIEEEPDKKKDEFVNNARNEPDKVTLDVLMSDVYTDSGSLTASSGWDENEQKTAYEKVKKKIIPMKTDGAWSRSANAAHTLRNLKEKREKLSVITPQYVHANMIISSVVINQDETMPFGWQGQIEFQHAYKEKPKKKDNSSKPKSKKTPVSPSGLSGIVQTNVTNTVNDVQNAVKKIIGG